MPGQEEELMHKWIEKNDPWNQVQSKRKGFDGDAALASYRLKQKLLNAHKCFKPINSKWSAKDVEKLCGIVQTINPCSDSDWNRVMNAFGQEHSLEEVKEQAKPMLFDFDQNGTPQSELIKKIKNLTPKGKLPTIGTLRRQVLADEVCKMLYLSKRVEQKKQALDFDSDDEFVHDAVEDPYLESTAISDKSLSDTQMAEITYGLLNDSCVLGSVENPIEIGDDFDMSNSRSNRYCYRYGALQLNPRLRHSQEDIDENGVEFLSDDEECVVVHSRTTRVKQEEDCEMRIKLELV
ncbi:hypothetical protein M3Y97_00893600 [Aphelenchoides bicaudatus]|nr:hypothetical protein M3Y97_00893600 [Aphelenchoides bicaudatus]